MSKYLFEVQYSSEGLSGLAADGAAKRLRDVKSAIKSLGGKESGMVLLYRKTAENKSPP